MNNMDQKIANSVSDSYYQISVRYSDMQEIPFPDGLKPYNMDYGGWILGNNLYVVTIGKFFSKKKGVVNSTGETIIELKLKPNANISLLAEQIIAVENRDNEVVLCDINGKEISDERWTKVEYLNNDKLALRNKKGLYAIADMKTNLLTEYKYINVNHYTDDLLLAYGANFVDVYDSSFNKAFTVNDVREMRAFCNGYRAFKNTGGKWGAIDEKGKIAVEPKFAWLRDCEYGLFVYSDTFLATSNDTMGLVNSHGNILINANKYKNLEILSENLLRHGNMEFVSWTEGQKNYSASRLIWGLMDVNGNEIVPPVFASVGDESEGLRSFIRYENGKKGETICGYMDKDWKTVITVARDSNIGTMADAFNHGKINSRLFLEDANRLMEKFIDGKAVVYLEQITDTYAEYIPGKRRMIDRSGKTIPYEEVDAKSSNNGSSQKSLIDNKTIKPKIKRPSQRNSNYENITFRTNREAVSRISGDMWIETRYDKTTNVILSSFETIDGFFCGLHAFRDKVTKKCGYMDNHGIVVVAPKYDCVSRIDRNQGLARIDKKYYILKRDMFVEGGQQTLSTALNTRDINNETK